MAQDWRKTVEDSIALMGTDGRDLKEAARILEVPVSTLLGWRLKYGIAPGKIHRRSKHGRRFLKGIRTSLREGLSVDEVAKRFYTTKEHIAKAIYQFSLDEAPRDYSPYTKEKKMGLEVTPPEPLPMKKRRVSHPRAFYDSIIPRPPVPKLAATVPVTTVVFPRAFIVISIFSFLALLLVGSVVIFLLYRMTH